MTSREERQEKRREERIQTAIIFGLIIMGFLAPMPKALAADIQSINDADIVLHQPEVELPNPYKLGLPRNLATKLAQYRLYREMLAEASTKSTDMQTIDGIKVKLQNARSYAIASLPNYDLTEDASIYLALALSEDPAQSRSRYAKALSLIRQLGQRPMSTENQQFISQLKSYIIDRIAKENLKS
jgi:hypothetical protein